ncbi:MAG: hypothetical protein ACYTEZ_07710 [Planctomycetota bacterium]|jgi:hypothetical protein
MRWFYLLCLLAACGNSGRDAKEVLLARRVALGLGEEPLAFADAMHAMAKREVEGLLARVGSRRLPREQVLDEAVRIESLLARADPASAGAYRAANPEEFDALAAQARRRALQFARAAAGEDARREAEQLLVACVDCHLTYRPRR